MWNHLQYLLQRSHHEVALFHQRMRNLEIGLIDDQIIYHQNVDIDDAVVIFSIYRLQGSAHLLLYPLGSLQHLTGSHGGENHHTGIDEVIGRRIAPRLGFVKSRLALYHANLLSYFIDSLTNITFPVTQIRAVG